MDTTVVAQTAIGALAGLGAGLGGAMIVLQGQRSTERSRQRERAAELFGAIGPLLTELDPDRIYFNLPLAESGQPDPMTETLRALGERAHAVREQLSMLAAWWPTSMGSELAQRLEVALLNTVIRDGWLVRDARRNRDTRPALEAAQNDHQQARSLASELRAEIRGQAAPARPSSQVGCAVLWHGQVRYPAMPSSGLPPAPRAIHEKEPYGAHHHCAHDEHYHHDDHDAADGNTGRQ